ncbi:MAG: hypothetical protein WCO60_04920 [Verrucomicrobiota bacterium]
MKILPSNHWKTKLLTLLVAVAIWYIIRHHLGLALSNAAGVASILR